MEIYPPEGNTIQNTSTSHHKLPVELRPLCLNGRKVWSCIQISINAHEGIPLLMGNQSEWAIFLS
jgi:hypothetical protein